MKELVNNKQCALKSVVNFHMPLPYDKWYHLIQETMLKYYTLHKQADALKTLHDINLIVVLSYFFNC